MAPKLAVAELLAGHPGGAPGVGAVGITCAWRGDFTNEAVNRVHAEGFGHRLLDDEWVGLAHRHSFGWVCAVVATGSSAS